MESLSLLKACLTYATIHNEDRCIWVDSRLNLKHLIEQRLFLFMPTRCVYNDDFIFLLSEETDTLLRNFDRVLLVFVTKEWTFNLCCVHFKLIKSTCSKGISTYKTDLPASLDILVSELGTSRCFT